VQKEVDPQKDDHLALMLEAAGVFAIMLATCVGVVFHHHLQPNERGPLDQGLKVLIWGGRDQYGYVSGLRAQLLEAKGLPPDENGLALPDWKDFLHVVRSGLESPRLMFQVPQVLRAAAVDLVKARSFLVGCGPDETALLKLAMLVANYFVGACRFPADAKARITEVFVKRMSEIASSAYRREGVGTRHTAADSSVERPQEPTLSQDEKRGRTRREARKPRPPGVQEDLLRFASPKKES